MLGAVGTVKRAPVYANVTGASCGPAARPGPFTSRQAQTGRSNTCKLRAKLAPIRCLKQLQPSRSKRLQVACSSGREDNPPKSTEFGYSRKDVILIGASIFGGGFAMYYGLQAVGVSAGIAGNYVQLFVVLGLCIGWVGSYIFRVANKDMTYVKQLQNYEEDVMAKRLEEMPESEREKLMASVEAEKERRAAKQQQQPK